MVEWNIVNNGTPGKSKRPEREDENVQLKKVQLAQVPL